MTGSTPRIPNHQRNIKVVYLHLRYRSPRSYFWPFFILFFRRMDYYGMRPVLSQMLWCRGYYLMWKLETGFCWNSLFACDMWILNSFCLVAGASCDHASLHFPLLKLISFYLLFLSFRIHRAYNEILCYPGIQRYLYSVNRQNFHCEEKKNTLGSL